MDQEPDVIRQQIEETRSSLTDKLETLENQVRGTVEGAKATVQETIASVKSGVQDTVASVKRTFDLTCQVRQHPWGMIAGSVLAGFVTGTLLHRRPTHHGGWGTIAPSRPGQDGAARSEAPRSSGTNLGGALAPPETPSLLGRLYQQFEGEIEQVKEVAIGAAMGLVRDLVKQSLPQLAPHIEQVMNSATTKMGGKPIDQPLVQPENIGTSSQRMAEGACRPHSGMTL
jgi:ElaB/YqjD/DUF883 family membrane-anchored ribosome-binding protein